MSGLRGNEFLIVAVVVLVLFGGSKLPQLARNMGRAQKEFKDGLSEGKTDHSADDGESSR
jgi:sec-independent protein translocase protein TatA